MRKIDWVVYAKAPFSGPEAVLAYLSRYTHRVPATEKIVSIFEEHTDIIVKGSRDIQYGHKINLLTRPQQRIHNHF